MKGKSRQVQSRQSHLPQITEEQAVAIARAKIDQSMTVDSAHASLPDGCSLYRPRHPPRNCWYVIAGPANKVRVGGPVTILCISKRSGRLIMKTTSSTE
jgi:hypothetical protein